MTQEALLTLQEGELVGEIEFIAVSVVKRSPAVRQLRQSVRDVVVGSSSAANVGASREQFRVYIKQLRISVSRLELQAVAHMLLCFHDERIVIGTDAVRAVVKDGIERVWARGALARADRRRIIGEIVVAIAIHAVVILKHRQMTA